MLTLLLAAAACAADPDIKCDGFGNSKTYDVINGVVSSPALGFTPAGEGVVAVCVRQPGSDTVGFVHLLDAYTGDVREVTPAKCGASLEVRQELMINEQSLVSVADNASVPDADLVFLSLNGSTSLTRKTSYGVCAGSNGESLFVIGGVSGEYQVFLEVYDNQGTLQQSLDLDSEPVAVAVSKLVGNSTSSDYYVAVAFEGLPLTVYDSNGDTVASYTLPRDAVVTGMKFRDDGNSLVIALFQDIIVFNIKTGANTTSSLPDLYFFGLGMSVAFNDDGSKMVASVQSLVGAPSVYVRDLDTGGGRMLCTVDDEPSWRTGVSFATDGQGRSVVLTYAYSQVNSSAPLRVTVFNVPDVTTLPATATPRTPVPTIPDTPVPINAPSDSGSIIGGACVGGVLLLVAGLGLWLWVKRQADPQTDSERLATAHTQDYHTM